MYPEIDRDLSQNLITSSCGKAHNIKIIIKYQHSVIQKYQFELSQRQTDRQTRGNYDYVFGPKNLIEQRSGTMKVQLDQMVQMRLLSEPTSFFRCQSEDWFTKKSVLTSVSANGTMVVQW